MKAMKTMRKMITRMTTTLARIIKETLPELLQALMPIEITKANGRPKRNIYFQSTIFCDNLITSKICDNIIL